MLEVDKATKDWLNDNPKEMAGYKEYCRALARLVEFNKVTSQKYCGYKEHKQEEE